jgi:hypothetical protein
VRSQKPWLGPRAPDARYFSIFGAPLVEVGAEVTMPVEVGREVAIAVEDGRALPDGLAADDDDEVIVTLQSPQPASPRQSTTSLSSGRCQRRLPGFEEATASPR